VEIESKPPKKVADNRKKLVFMAIFRVYAYGPKYLVLVQTKVEFVAAGLSAQPFAVYSELVFVPLEL